jgi:hypothetical protein
MALASQHGPSGGGIGGGLALDDEEAVDAEATEVAKRLVEEQARVDGVGYRAPTARWRMQVCPRGRSVLREGCTLVPCRAVLGRAGCLARGQAGEASEARVGLMDATPPPPIVCTRAGGRGAGAARSRRRRRWGSGVGVREHDSPRRAGQSPAALVGPGEAHKVCLCVRWMGPRVLSPGWACQQAAARAHARGLSRGAIRWSRVH